MFNVSISAGKKFPKKTEKVPARGNRLQDDLAGIIEKLLQAAPEAARIHLARLVITGDDNGGDDENEKAGVKTPLTFQFDDLRL